MRIDIYADLLSKKLLKLRLILEQLQSLKIMMKRRSLLGYFGISWLASCFPIALAAYDPNKSIAESISNKDTVKPRTKKPIEGFTVVGSISELQKTGHLQTKEVTVLIDPDNPKKLIAVNPKCTHQGCDVKWSTGAKRYECPCHGANFDANGEVLNGPATRPLTAYPAKIVGTQVLVKISPVDPHQNSTPLGRGRTR
jgi:cytochrome b6-f complex iron-sulfur subunit